MSRFVCKSCAKEDISQQSLGDEFTQVAEKPEGDVSQKSIMLSELLGRKTENIMICTFSFKQLGFTLHLKEMPWCAIFVGSVTDDGL